MTHDSKFEPQLFWTKHDISTTKLKLNFCEWKGKIHLVSLEIKSITELRSSKLSLGHVVATLNQRH